MPLHCQHSFLSILAGAIADNFSHRGGDVWRPMRDRIGIQNADDTVGLGFVHPWLILGFLAGCGFALNDPAWHASDGDILDKRDIPAAVTLMSVGYNIVRSIGPALGGVSWPSLDRWRFRPRSPE
ncbi:MFS transporter [Mesorhizobium sp. M0029]|uniref:MFS transporter n=1 Tax=Mesorhizobium sp. M0029 TaxID=2956850 RepID=UPI00333C571B